MKGRRFSLPRLLKWPLTAAFGLVLVSMLYCLYWRFSWVVNYREWNVAIGGGGILTSGSSDTGRRPMPIWRKIPPGAPPTYASWDALATNWYVYGRWPHMQYTTGTWGFVLPLWIPLLLSGGPAGLLWWLDSRRPRRGRCVNCGYDLTGNVSGTCPECGAVAEAAAERPIR